MMTKMRTCDRPMARVFAIRFHSPHSWHGNMVLGSEEKGLRSAYICIDDGSEHYWEQSKQASKQAMHSGELGSMETRRWVIQRFV